MCRPHSQVEIEAFCKRRGYHLAWQDEDKREGFLFDGEVERVAIAVRCDKSNSGNGEYAVFTPPKNGEIDPTDPIASGPLPTSLIRYTLPYTLPYTPHHPTPAPA